MVLPQTCRLPISYNNKKKINNKLSKKIGIVFALKFQISLFYGFCKYSIRIGFQILLYFK